MTLRLRNDHAAEIIGYAMDEHPKEACGVIVTHVRTGESRVVQLRNVHDEPESGFEVREREVRDLYRKLNRTFEFIETIWHSHTHSPPVPSAGDIAAAEMPEAHYLIVATDGEGPALRSWMIVGGEPFEEPIVFVKSDS